MAESVGNGLKNEDGLLGDFRADTVAGEDGEVQEHEGISLMESTFAVQDSQREKRSLCRNQEPGFARRTAEGGCPHMIFPKDHLPRIVREGPLTRPRDSL